MKRMLDVRKLDVIALARRGEMLSGSCPLAPMERLGSMQVGPPGAVDWTVRAYRDDSRAIPGVHMPGEPLLWLHLTATGRIGLVCQRCLEPVDVPIQVDRRFLFVETEQRAAELDAAMSEDVLALMKTFDLLELVEDEVLLDLPIVPLHTHCEHAAGGLEEPDADTQPKEAHPFAALGAWRTRGKD